MSSNGVQSFINLFVRGFKGNTMTVDIHPDAFVKDLFSKLKDKTGLDVGAYQLVFVGKTIEYKQHKDKRLSDLDIGKNSTLCMVMRLHGGTKVLDDDVELTDLPDMITWDDDKDSQRAKMPCGHAIGPESLTSYCRSLLDAGKYRFLCPWVDPTDSSRGCPAEWQYVVVRKLAVLTDSERHEFERKISENYIRRMGCIQDCPGCRSYCMRKDPSNIRVVCAVCTMEKGSSFDFCWYCLNTWRTSGTTNCGNTYCSGKDPRLAILERAPTKEIVGVPDVPSRRACPKCGMLIEHIKACKHMKCVCEAEFCFICLKPQVDGQWQCGSYDAKCTVAPRQTQLPSK